jgi:hypothetical protein
VKSKRKRKKMKMREYDEDEVTLFIKKFNKFIKKRRPYIAHFNEARRHGAEEGGGEAREGGQHDGYAAMA